MLQQLINSVKEGSKVFEIGIVIGAENRTNYISKDYSETEKTGRLTVELTSDSSQVTAPYLMPLAGDSQILGGVPEAGAMCLLVAIGESEYVILGFLPTPLDMMISKRHELDSLMTGEIVMQSSTYDGEGEHWKGASAKFDTYGRLIIKSGDEKFKITVGDLLSDEYTDDMVIVKDTITQLSLVYKQEYGQFSNSIDSNGSLIQRWHNILSDIKGDIASTAGGSLMITTGKDIKLNAQGSYMYITKDGFQLESLSKFDLSATGPISIDTDNRMALKAFADMIINSLSVVKIKGATGVSLGGMKVDIQSNTLLNLVSLTAAITMTSATNITITSPTTNIVSPMINLTPAPSDTVLKASALLTWLDLPGHYVDSLGLPCQRVIPATPMIPTLGSTMVNLS